MGTAVGDRSDGRRGQRGVTATAKQRRQRGGSVIHE